MLSWPDNEDDAGGAEGGALGMPLLGSDVALGLIDLDSIDFEVEGGKDGCSACGCFVCGVAGFSEAWLVVVGTVEVPEAAEVAEGATLGVLKGAVDVEPEDGSSGVLTFSVSLGGKLFPADEFTRLGFFLFLYSQSTSTFLLSGSCSLCFSISTLSCG